MLVAQVIYNRMNQGLLDLTNSYILTDRYVSVRGLLISMCYAAVCCRFLAIHMSGASGTSRVKWKLYA